MDESHFFKPSELLLPYDKWQSLVIEKKAGIGHDVRTWLAAWGVVDMGLSPCDDDYRRTFRLGHYVGWFDARQRAGL